MVQTLDPAKVQAWNVYLSMMEQRVFDALPYLRRESEERSPACRRRFSVEGYFRA